MLVCAVSGMITAARKRMDIVGTYCLAVVTAFGGGTLRDLLIDRRPSSGSATTSTCSSSSRCAWPSCTAGRSTRAPAAGTARRVIVDAMGLALFTLTGVGFALDKGLPLFVVVAHRDHHGHLRRRAARRRLDGDPGDLPAGRALRRLVLRGAWVYIGAHYLGMFAASSPARRVPHGRRPAPGVRTPSACACRIRCGCARSAGRLGSDARLLAVETS